MSRYLKDCLNIADNNMSEKTITQQNGQPTMSAAEATNGNTTKVVIEYGKETLKLLDSELLRLHEIVKANPKEPPQWAIKQIHEILSAVLAGTPIHSIPPKQNKS